MEELSCMRNWVKVGTGLGLCPSTLLLPCRLQLCPSGAGNGLKLCQAGFWEGSSMGTAAQALSRGGDPSPGGFGSCGDVAPGTGALVALALGLGGVGAFPAQRVL